MMHPNTTREVLIAEVLGDAAGLIRQVEALTPALDEARKALEDAHGGLAHQLASFESQILAVCDKAKVQAVKHIVARSDDAARRSVELLARAMADAARVAFGAQIGATVERLQAAIQPVIERPRWNWEAWLTHCAAAATASAATWAAMLFLYAR